MQSFKNNNLMTGSLINFDKKTQGNGNEQLDVIFGRTSERKPLTVGSGATTTTITTHRQLQVPVTNNQIFHQQSSDIFNQY